MSYIGNTPGVSSQRVVLEEVISGSPKSVFTPISGYIKGYVDVLINGHELDTSDFTADDGVTVSLVEAAAVGDTVKVKTWLPRGLSDGYLKSEVDAFLATLYTKTEADARYLNLAGGTLTGGLTAAGNFLMTANSGNTRVVGVSNGTNTTLVLQGGGNGAGALGGNIELGRDGNNMYDAAVSRFRSLDGSTVYGEFNASGFGIGTNTPQRRVHFYDTGIFPLLIESNNGDAVALEIKHTNSRAWAIAVAGPSSAVGQTAGNFYLYDEAAGTVRLVVDTTGNLKFNSGYGSMATAYGCRAWVMANAAGTVLGSGNVSSVTKNATAVFTANFATAMPDTNYGMYGFCRSNGGTADFWLSTTSTATKTTSAFQFTTRYPTGQTDPTDFSISFVR